MRREPLRMWVVIAPSIDGSGNLDRNIVEVSENSAAVLLV